ncbi:hypothetical protein PHYBLDRAFT_10352, partial [Phycomyces blakesleeanus NRRL 1555(-)]
LLAIGCIAIILDSFVNHQRDVSGCRDSYTRPLFIQQTGFDSEMTRFAGKYALYLYREKGIDTVGQLTGVPVLFIPGHAGSYKQMRSIATEASYYYYDNYTRQHESWENGKRSLDFFTVDFNEEFSALHGQSLLEQAEYLNDCIDYILKLYPQSRKLGPKMNENLPDPNSVIIVGHSMGGIVARAMFTINNYQPGTINTVLTLSSPHLLPPVPFDWKISKLYDDIYKEWHNGFSHDTSHGVHSLKDVSLVSIAGGTLDTIICSDSANVATFIPPTNGFTVFSTAVPHVWTGTDHNSILSCSQLIKVVAKALLDCVDARRATQTKPLEDRMKIMRKAFLSGLEDRQGNAHVSGISQGAFSILTDQSIDTSKQFDILLCNKLNQQMPDTTRVGCRPARSIAVPVPASSYKDTDSFSGNTFTFASIAFAEMLEYEYLAIAHRPSLDGFLIAEAFDMQDTHQTIDDPMVSIARHSLKIELEPALFSSVRIPAIENPMLAYHLKVSRPQCKQNEGMFAPFLRQSISTMHESKFHVNLASGNKAETEVSLHGRTAFSSISINSLKESQQGLVLQVWMDPVCPYPLTIELEVDWYGSAGRLGFRNGIMLATFSFVIVILVLASQIQCYNKTGIFPHFGNGIAYCLCRTLPIVMVLLAVCCYYQPTGYQNSPEKSIPLTWNHVWESRSLPVAWNDILIGNTDPFFWWLPLVGVVLSFGTVCLLWIILQLVLWLGAALCSLFYSVQIPCRIYSRSNETPYQRHQRRAITTLVLFALVATCIPYQFVFVVAFLVHIITCIRSLLRTWTALPAQEQKRLNRYNYMQSIMFLFITLLPFNLPILLVWIRNLSVHWFVPFSSDHSVMAIAPFMLYVELLTGNHKMLPRLNSRYWNWATYLILYSIVVYAFLYGIKYTHSLYFISNHLVCWFLLLHFGDSGY